jgi:hypothetical protein
MISRDPGRARRAFPNSIDLENPAAGGDLDGIADAYVQLVLAVHRHDPRYLDYYFGPASWRERARRSKPRPPGLLRAEAEALLRRLEAATPSERRTFLERRLGAVEAYTRILSGQRLAWSDECRLLYDVDPVEFRPERFEAARERLESLLPGRGSFARRITSYYGSRRIERRRLSAVVKAIVAETRRRTAALVELPAGEALRISFVRGRSWWAWNRYQGNLRSHIQINVNQSAQAAPLFTVVAHEGYPGHHAFYAVREQVLVRLRRLREFAVCPLFSPQALIGEGAAKIGLRVIMGWEDRLAFVQETLARVGGLSGGDFHAYLEIWENLEGLEGVAAEAARRLVQENRSEREVAAFMTRYGFATSMLESNLRFFKNYRAYVCCYARGEDLVRTSIGSGPERARRYFGLFTRPLTPSGILAAGYAGPGTGPDG